jgi:hypothetical protein
MFADAVGRLHENVAFLELDCPIVDLDLGIHAQRPAEIALLRRYDDAKVVGELLQRTSDPRKRYEELSEFVFDLRHPNDSFLRSSTAPLLERNPLLFWKALSFLLACVVVGLAYTLNLK